MQQWHFHNNNTQRLEKSLSRVDREKFDLDVGSLDWEEYYYNYVRGIRTFLFDDPLDSAPDAIARYAKYDLFNYLQRIIYDILIAHVSTPLGAIHLDKHFLIFYFYVASNSV